MGRSTPLGVLVETDKVDWVAPDPQTSYKLLWSSDETGAWTMLVSARAGTVNARHRHLGPSDFFVLSGRVDYEGGSAGPGDWLYEPTGAIHAATTHPVDTVYLANVRGPLEILDDHDAILTVVDLERFRTMLANAPAARAS